MVPKGVLGNVALAVLASPTYAVVGARRLLRSVRFVRMTGRRTIVCPTCGETVLLVGFWRCGCGFTYRGHLLRLCPVCRTLPDVIRCEHCGATERVRR
jgi:hypothetical protein